MTASQALLLLRLIEVSYMMLCLWWVIDSPKSRLRTIRLWACWVIIMFNLAAILIATMWLKVQLW